MTNSASTRLAIDVGIIVTDMDQSLRFYRELLGLPIVAEATTSLIGKGKMMQLEYGASLIKLVQLDDTPARQTPSDIAAAIGYRYITLLVADIAAIMAKVEQMAVPISLPLTRLGTGSIIAMVQDPDGNIIEFVQEANL